MCKTFKFADGEGITTYKSPYETLIELLDSEDVESNLAEIRDLCERGHFDEDKLDEIKARFEKLELDLPAGLDRQIKEARMELDFELFNLSSEKKEEDKWIELIDELLEKFEEFTVTPTTSSVSIREGTPSDRENVALVTIGPKVHKDGAFFHKVEQIQQLNSFVQRGKLFNLFWANAKESIVNIIIFVGCKHISG